MHLDKGDANIQADIIPVSQWCDDAFNFQCRVVKSDNKKSDDGLTKLINHKLPYLNISRVILESHEVKKYVLENKEQFMVEEWAFGRLGRTQQM